MRPGFAPLSVVFINFCYLVRVGYHFVNVFMCLFTLDMSFVVTHILSHIALHVCPPFYRYILSFVEMYIYTPCSVPFVA